MTTPRKKPVKKPLPKKKPRAYKFVGINCDGEVFASDGPIQLLCGATCIWPSSSSPNSWTDSVVNALHAVDNIRCLDSYEVGCMEYKEYLRRYPENVSDLRKQQQIKFSM